MSYGGEGKEKEEVAEEPPWELCRVLGSAKEGVYPFLAVAVELLSFSARIIWDGPSHVGTFYSKPSLF